jgi:DNA helicase-2/ATP-dependent DNA helicase PcrA
MLAMNKLIIAAAGSGKTTLIVDTARELPNARILITTFTNANEHEIKKKFYAKGGIPNNVTVQTWFSFLLQHGVKPFQGVYTQHRVNGVHLVNSKSAVKYIGGKFPICWSEDESFEKHYFDSEYRVYTDKISKLVCRCDEKSEGRVFMRISDLFTHIFVDEVQDMAGYD